jgi:hypothetical protein
MRYDTPERQLKRLFDYLGLSIVDAETKAQHDAAKLDTIRKFAAHVPSVRVELPQKSAYSWRANTKKIHEQLLQALNDGRAYVNGLSIISFDIEYDFRCLSGRILPLADVSQQDGIAERELIFDTIAIGCCGRSGISFSELTRRELPVFENVFNLVWEALRLASLSAGPIFLVANDPKAILDLSFPELRYFGELAKAVSRG